MEENKINETKSTTSMAKDKSLPLPIILLGVVVVGALLGSVIMKAMANQSNQPAQMNMETSSTPGSNPATVTQDDTDARVIAIEAGSFYFNPNEIHVKKGEKVKIVMTSKDMMHNFVIDELNVHLPITKSGDTSSVVFTADKVGTFEYYCSVGQHRAHGQVGKIVVEE
jgi:heme/copper-type cytochrome/quinol oxidase subunit 2